MAKQFFLGGKKAASALCALASTLFLMTSCSTEQAQKNQANNANKDDIFLPANGPIDGNVIVAPPQVVDVPVPVPPPPLIWDTIELIARTDPADPHNERFLDDWVFRIFNIDDEARIISPVFGGESGPNGVAIIGLPIYMFALPLVVTAFNEAFPPNCPRHHHHDHHDGHDGHNGHDNHDGRDGHDDDDDNHHGRDRCHDKKDKKDCQCTSFEIFIPPFCYDKAVWLLGPFEDALWSFYRRAAKRGGEAWNPSQVDCGTWIANLQWLILTDEITDELNELSDRDDMIFREDALITALQENTHLLTPTRPPICMAERRHNGGGMERGEIIPSLPVTIDDFVPPFETEVLPDSDPIIIGTNGVVDSICFTALDGQLTINGVNFFPTNNYYLDDPDFLGTIHDQANVVPNIDATIFNTRLGNGRELDHDKYDDACALTSIIEFTNIDDDENDILSETGVYFTNLFGADDATVFLTSDGDDVVDDNDYWAIFFDGHADCLDNARVLAVELLGHRQVDFRDVLHMTFDPATDDLFLGLRADYELNEEEVDGERAFLAYTLSTWDGSTKDGREQTRVDISNCYEAADVWARQFFVTDDFQELREECCIDEDCDIEKLISPLLAAEFAVRSQCFSNSRANQRWRTDASGFWSINTDHGVHGNVIVNPGWLAPFMDYEIFIQKFDEAVFKGPRTIRRTDEVGQLMAELPTLVEGDRVLLKSEDNCCDDYDLVIPCVPEFTGFAGAPGIPFIPVTLGPPPPPPLGIAPIDDPLIAGPIQ